jgi:heptosyltransferase-2
MILSSPSRILVIQTAFLGDLILTTPLLEALKYKYPHSEIDIVVNKGTESVLFGNPHLREVIPLDKKLAKKSIRYFWQFGQSLRKKEYTLVICPHFSFRSSILSWITGAKTRIGYKESGFSFLHTETVSRPRLGPHEVEKLFSLIFSDPELYPKGRGRRPSLYPTESEVSEAKALLNERALKSKEYIVLSPSSVWETKKYPEEGFIQLGALILQNTNYQLVLSGAPGDITLTESICSGILSILTENKFKDWERNPSRVHNLAGKTGLGSLGVLIREARAIVTNDSSPVHYASAFNTPTLMIYGATIPGFGYSALADKRVFSEIHNLSCRPCGIHGGRVCPQGHFRCMKDQSPQELFRLLETLLV